MAIFATITLTHSEPWVEADVIRWLKIAGFVAAMVTAVPFPARAQDIRGIVVDQTGLPLPGTTVQLRDGEIVVATTSTRGDGTFAFDGGLRGATCGDDGGNGFHTEKRCNGDARRRAVRRAGLRSRPTGVASRRPSNRVHAACRSLRLCRCLLRSSSLLRSHQVNSGDAC